MRIDKELSQEMYKVLNNYRKVSKLSVNEDDMYQYFNTINDINSLSEDDMIYQGQTLSKWNITNFFSFMILPNRVSVGTSNYEKDLLIRPSKDNDIKVLSMKQFNDITEAINICYKKTDGNVTTIESLKTDLMLSNAIERVVNDSALVMSKLDMFMPLQLSIDVISERYFIEDAANAVINHLKNDLMK
jgi:hypothetical protein